MTGWAGLGPKPCGAQNEFRGVTAGPIGTMRRILGTEQDFWGAKGQQMIIDQQAARSGHGGLWQGDQEGLRGRDRGRSLSYHEAEG